MKARRLEAARLAVPIAASLVAVGFSLVAHQLFEPSPYLPLLAAVTFSAWYGGLRPGLISTALCAAASIFLYVPPVLSFAASLSAELFRLLVFVVVALFVTLLSSSLRREQAAAEEERKRSSDAAIEVGRSRDQMDVILQSVADGIVACDPRGGVVYTNSTASEILGYPSIDALRLDKHLQSLDRLRAVDQHDNSVSLGNILRGKVATSSITNDVILRLHSPDAGGIRLVVVKSTSIGGLDGPNGLVLTILRDVTNRERTENTLRLLAEAGASFATSLDYDAIVQLAARLAVPRLADWCVVWFRESEKGSFRRHIAVAHINREIEPRLLGLEEARVFQHDASSGPDHVFQTGQPELEAIGVDGDLRAFQQQRSYVELARELDLRSWIHVPLGMRGAVLGVMTLAGTNSRRRFDAADLSVAKDVARRVAQSLDNARLYQETEETLRLHDEFLTSVSHDVKSPLATIKGVAQFMRRSVDRTSRIDIDRLRAGLINIDLAATTIASLVDELLDVARLRAGQQLTLKLRRCDLVDLVRRAIDRQQQTTDRHKIRMFHGNDVDRLEGEWDADRIERVLGNLLGNAVKFSPEGGEIDVRVWDEWNSPTGERQRRWAFVSVKDPGVGIPEIDISHVFERFHRGRNVEGKIAGSGIGLAGSRQIVEQHGGAVKVESQEGAGSTFTVQLPMSGDRTPI